MLEADRILSTSLDEPLSIIALPLPEFVDLDNMQPDRLLDLISHFFTLWSSLLSTHSIELPESYVIAHPLEEGNLTLEGNDLWDYLFMIIAAYYRASHYRYTKYPLRDREVVPAGARGDDPKSFMATEGFEPKLSMLRLLSYQYFGTLREMQTVEAFKHIPSAHTLASHFEDILHAHLEGYFEIMSVAKGQWLELALSHLFGNLLSLVQEKYESFTVQNPSHLPGPFSAIRLPELALLATRHDSVLARYGANHVPRVFENQLALIAQSFGLYVVSTKVGQSTVDLVCISSDPSHRVTFLIEAKTTKRSYYLPKDDARALRDYVESVRSSLTTLPPLYFVLIVGPEPSSTLRDKLVALEAKLQLPIRFLTAQTLANLREHLAGPLPMATFVDYVLRSEPIIPGDIANEIAKASRLEHEAHSKFVSSLLSVKGQT